MTGKGHRQAATSTPIVGEFTVMSTPSSPPPYGRAEHRATGVRVDADAVATTATLLRQLATYDAQADARRGALSFALAALIEACGRGFRESPHEVAFQARRVAEAADRATDNRR
ncbi:MAG: hypothetical protein ACRDT0_05255 [Pseudonocardiaceae bacterium]